MSLAHLWYLLFCLSLKPSSVASGWLWDKVQTFSMAGKALYGLAPVSLSNLVSPPSMHTPPFLYHTIQPTLLSVPQTDSSNPQTE